MLGGTGGRRKRGRQRMRWLNGITDSMDMSLNSGRWWWTGRPGVLRFMGSQRVGHDWATELKGLKQTRLCTQPRWPTRPKIFTPVASYRKRPSSREEGLMVETLLALQTLEIGEHWEILWSSELLESAGQDRIGRYKKQREGNMFDSHSCERPAVL